MGFLDGGAGKAAKTIRQMWNIGRQDLMPYMDLGKRMIPEAEGFDITGGAGEFLEQLKNLGTTFRVDTEDPTYQWRLGESEKGINKFLASRGLYNSRAGLNALQESTNQISAEESANQWQRKYGSLLDAFNMASSLGQSGFSKLYNLLGVGSGAASQGATNAMQAGQGIASAQLQGGANKMGFISDLLGLGTNVLGLNFLKTGNWLPWSKTKEISKAG